MSHHHDDDEKGNGLNRRHALECMIWAGTGIMWTLSGGVPKALNLLSEAQAAEAVTSGFTFLQRFQTSHIGFDKEAKVTARDTLGEAIDKVKALTMKPAPSRIHTGDITHLSKADQFDDAQKMIGSVGVDVHYVPGEHDMVDADQGKGLYGPLRQRYLGPGLVLVRPERRPLHRPQQCDQPQGRRARQSRRRTTGLAGEGSGEPLCLDADRGLCPHSALDDLRAMGLGHR